MALDRWTVLSNEVEYMLLKEDIEREVSISYNEVQGVIVRFHHR